MNFLGNPMATCSAESECWGDGECSDCRSSATNDQHCATSYDRNVEDYTDNESSSTSLVDTRDEGVGGEAKGESERDAQVKDALYPEGSIQELNPFAFLQDATEDGVDDKNEVDDDERYSLSSGMSDSESNTSEDESEDVKRLKLEIQLKQREIYNLRCRARIFDDHAKMDIKFGCAHGIVSSFAVLVAECEECCEPLTVVSYADMDLKCH